MEDSEQEKAKMRTKYGKFKQVFDDGLVKKNAQGMYEVVHDAEEAAQIKEAATKKKRRKTMTAADADLASVQLS